MSFVAIPTGQIIGKFTHAEAKPRAGALDTMNIQYDRKTGEREIHFMVEDRATDGKVLNYLYCVAKGDEAIAAVEAKQWQVVEITGLLNWNRTSKFLSVTVAEVK
jgi:hypothetical protein